MHVRHVDFVTLTFDLLTMQNISMWYFVGATSHSCYGAFVYDLYLG